MSSRASDMDSVLDGYAQDIRLSSPVTEEELSRLTREQLLALIARERSEKEELEGRLVVLSTEHATLTDDHAGLSRAHALADNKLQTAYDTASRLEEQLASQHEQMESLTSRMAVKEKELRESNRRKKDEVRRVDSLVTFQADFCPNSLPLLRRNELALLTTKSRCETEYLT